jgi:hypothetical protein
MKIVTAAAGAALALSTLPLLPAIATADGDGRLTTAQVEYAERQAANRGHPTKAQIEAAERTNETQRSTSEDAGSLPRRAPLPGGDDAAAWQIALSAALGAALTGAAVLGARQATRHGHAVAG